MISVKDDIASERVLSFTPKVGSVTIKKIVDLAKEENVSIFDLLVNEDKSALHTVTKLLDNLGEVLKKAYELFLANSHLEEIMKYVLIESGYENRLKVLDDKDNIQNINALYDQLRNFDENFDPSFYLEENKLIAFLQEESLTGDIDETEYADKVSLLTVHAAKGLENKIVFVAGLNQGIFPSRLSSNIEAEIEEERRAFYVALTRAKERLFVTYVKGDYSYIMQSELLPSKFIYELNKEFYEFESQFVNSPFMNSNDIQPRKISPIINPTQFTNFKVGDIVNHMLFGEGVVVKVVGPQLQISFNNKGYGVMMISANNSALTKK